MPKNFSLAAVVASAVEVGSWPGRWDSNDWSAVALAVVSCRCFVLASAGLAAVLLLALLLVRRGGFCQGALVPIPLGFPLTVGWVNVCGVRV